MKRMLSLRLYQKAIARQRIMAYHANPPVIPANVQYWFNYCAQWNNAPGGNVLHLFPNNIAIPLNTPLVGGPPSQPAPFNAYSLISNPNHGQRPLDQRHPNDRGWGVFLGFYMAQDPDLPPGNASSDPRRWQTVYGKVVHPRRGRGQSRRPAPRLMVWRRPRTYTGQVNNIARCVQIPLNSFSTIQSLRGLNRGQIQTYVQTSQAREQGNQPGEYDANLTHLRDLQLAHVSQFIGQRQARLRAEYGL